MREITRKARKRGLRVGLVPTMGALHEGHLSLIRRANEITDVVVTSIFVNPAQFAPGDDLERYPRDLPRDTELCGQNGVDYVFAPEPVDLYPPGPRTWVEVAELSDRLEGASRPGHFRGVATVVLKLLQVVRPDLVVFGRKDAQQAVVIRRMVEDLMFDVEMLVLPTVREEDGLALSSRNRYLSPEERKAAAAVPRAIEAVRELRRSGTTSAEELKNAARTLLDAEPLLRIDYVELVDRGALSPLAQVDGDALLLLAVHCGETRLIDNEILGAPEEAGESR